VEAPMIRLGSRISQSLANKALHHHFQTSAA
jgi:hypothetical protein